MRAQKQQVPMAASRRLLLPALVLAAGVAALFAGLRCAFVVSAVDSRPRRRTTLRRATEVAMPAASSTKTPTLFSPVKLGALELQNRIIMAPLTRGRSGPTRTPNDLNKLYYEQRAANTGLIIAEATTVSETANGWNGSPGIYKPEHAEGWKEVVSAVHAKGSKIVLQLWHMGRAAHSSFIGQQIVAPSAIKIDGSKFGSDGVYGADFTKQPYEEPRALETEEIPALVESYATAAAFAKEAGFDGVEVHSANGYLLDTFLQSSTNKRTDSYGGSIPNRFKLLDEVLSAVFRSWPSDRVGVRLAPNGIYNDMGSEDNIETFTYALQELSKKDLAYVHLMDGLAFGFHKKCDPFTIDALRKAYTGPIIANCGYTQDSAEKVLAAGDADAVAFGRAFIANPDLALRFANDWPLADADMATWYGGGAEGYTTYPAYQP